MEKSVCMECGSVFEWSRKFYEDHDLPMPPLHCPTCNDIRARKDPHNVVQERELLQVWECVDISQAVDHLSFTLIEEHDGQPLARPYRRATVKGRRFGASWSGRIDVFDQRTDTDTHFARVRVMRTEHQAGVSMIGVRVTGPSFPWYSREVYEWEHSSSWEYVVLEDTDGDEAEVKLVFATAIQKWNRSDRIEGDPLWQVGCQGKSRSGRHSGQAALAVVDEEHPLIAVRVQDHGALHQGDRIVIERGTPTQVEAMLASKESKEVEVVETCYTNQK